MHSYASQRFWLRLKCYAFQWFGYASQWLVYAFQWFSYTGAYGTYLCTIVFFPKKRKKRAIISQKQKSLHSVYQLSNVHWG